MIPYLVFHRDVTDKEFQQLVSQLKPWGVPVMVFHRRDNMRHLETPGDKGTERVLHGTRVRTQHGQSVPGGRWGESS